MGPYQIKKVLHKRMDSSQNRRKSLPILVYIASIKSVETVDEALSVNLD